MRQPVVPIGTIVLLLLLVAGVFAEDDQSPAERLRLHGIPLRRVEQLKAAMNRVRDDMAEVAKVEAFPRMEGRQMTMVIVPK